MVVPRALVFRVLFKLKQKFSKVSRSSGHVLKCLLTDRAILEYIRLVAKTQGARCAQSLHYDPELNIFTLQPSHSIQFNSMLHSSLILTPTSIITCIPLNSAPSSLVKLTRRRLYDERGIMELEIRNFYDNIAEDMAPWQYQIIICNKVASKFLAILQNMNILPRLYTIPTT